jgi:hypothetical protein
VGGEPNISTQKEGKEEGRKRREEWASPEPKPRSKAESKENVSQQEKGNQEHSCLRAKKSQQKVPNNILYQPL